MKKFLIVIAAAIAVASCAPVDTPAPTVTPQGEDRFLADPRIGYPTAIPAPLASRFDQAWRWVLAGDETEARRRLTQILTESPDFAPAMLAQAALDIRAGRYAEASGVVDLLQQRVPGYTAARLYEAEIAWRERKTRVAYDLYQAIAADPNAPPWVADRLSELQQQIFNELYAAAQTTSDAEAERLLREALAINAGATDARILLAQKLVAGRRFEEARRELDPLLDTAADRAEVQEMLGEIDAGRGRYQEAIARYDRLARRTRDPRYERRLEEIKLEWSAANMPSHFRVSLDSPALTRADLATLLYWTVPSVRFAQNLPTPPIAVDVEDVQGREEIIRAIAIGVFDVDPVTRRVSPARIVTAARLSASMSRLLSARGASCARGVPLDRVLSTCGVEEPLSKHGPDDTVTGREAAAILGQVAKSL